MENIKRRQELKNQVIDEQGGGGDDDYYSDGDHDATAVGNGVIQALTQCSVSMYSN